MVELFVCSVSPLIMGTDWECHSTAFPPAEKLPRLKQSIDYAPRSMSTATYGAIPIYKWVFQLSNRWYSRISPGNGRGRFVAAQNVGSSFQFFRSRNSFAIIEKRISCSPAPVSRGLIAVRITVVVVSYDIRSLWIRFAVRATSFTCRRNSNSSPSEVVHSKGCVIYLFMFQY